MGGGRIGGFTAIEGTYPWGVTFLSRLGGKHPIGEESTLGTRYVLDWSTTGLLTKTPEAGGKPNMRYIGMDVPGNALGKSSWLMILPQLELGFSILFDHADPSSLKLEGEDFSKAQQAHGTQGVAFLQKLSTDTDLFEKVAGIPDLTAIFAKVPYLKAEMAKKLDVKPGDITLLQYITKAPEVLKAFYGQGGDGQESYIDVHNGLFKKLFETVANAVYPGDTKDARLEAAKKAYMSVMAAAGYTATDPIGIGELKPETRNVDRAMKLQMAFIGHMLCDQLGIGNYTYSAPTPANIYTFITSITKGVGTFSKAAEMVGGQVAAASSSYVRFAAGRIDFRYKLVQGAMDAMAYNNNTFFPFSGGLGGMIDFKKSLGIVNLYARAMGGTTGHLLFGNDWDFENSAEFEGTAFTASAGVEVMPVKGLSLRLDGYYGTNFEGSDVIGLPFYATYKFPNKIVLQSALHMYWDKQRQMGTSFGLTGMFPLWNPASLAGNLSMMVGVGAGTHPGSSYSYGMDYIATPGVEDGHSYGASKKGIPSHGDPGSTTIPGEGSSAPRVTAMDLLVAFNYGGLKTGPLSWAFNTQFGLNFYDVQNGVSGMFPGGIDFKAILGVAASY